MPSMGSKGAYNSSTSSQRWAIPRQGDVLADKYRLERVLGEGGMGCVFEATHLDLETRVAIKVLRPGAGEPGEATHRLIREARAVTRVRSEHVVRVFDVGRLQSGVPYIVMELLEGADLARWVDHRGPLPVEEAVQYVLQACEGVAAAHAVGVVHRDLKPANLFLTRRPDGEAMVKVLDFGISKLDADTPGVTTSTTILGTPCFMSPEQLRSTRDVDGRTDVWALGTILHALLTGEPPFVAESTAEVAAKVMRDAPLSIRFTRPEASPELSAVVLRCLEKDRDDRYASVADLARALAPFAGALGPVVVRRIEHLGVLSSAATAPTLRSSRPPAQAAPKPDEPTRTASAWGESERPVERPRVGGRRVLAAAAVLGCVAAFGAIRLSNHPASEAASPAPIGTTALLAAPVPVSAALPVPAAAVAVADPAPPAPEAAKEPRPDMPASSTPPEKSDDGSLSRPQILRGATADRARRTANRRATSAGEAAEDPPPPKTAGALFEGRD